jgi:ribonuclease BN (tRNA processing enzyme)
MRLRILGAHCLSSSETRYVSLVVDDVLALDAGCLTQALSFVEQSRLAAVFLSHRHYDHIRDIPALGLNLFRMATQTEVFCGEEVQQTLVNSLLNGEVYPRLHEEPSENPTLRFTRIEPNRSVAAGGLVVIPRLVNHASHSLGFEVSDRNGRVLFYTSDTGPLPDSLWSNIDVHLLVIEVTAPNSQTEFVRAAGHMSPALLEEELARFKKFHGYLPKTLVVHMDPLLGKNGTLGAELAEVARRLNADIHLAQEGDEMDV